MIKIKVIQHVNRIEHITDNLQTKSLEFTYEFIGNVRRKDSLILTENVHKPIADTINTPSIGHVSKLSI
jgi:hypothetical protein